MIHAIRERYIVCCRGSGRSCPRQSRRRCRSVVVTPPTPFYFPPPPRSRLPPPLLNRHDLMTVCGHQFVHQRFDVTRRYDISYYRGRILNGGICVIFVDGQSGHEFCVRCNIRHRGVRWYRLCRMHGGLSSLSSTKISFAWNVQLCRSIVTCCLLVVATLALPSRKWSKFLFLLLFIVIFSVNVVEFNLLRQIVGMKAHHRLASGLSSGVDKNDTPATLLLCQLPMLFSHRVATSRLLQLVTVPRWF